MTKGKAAVPPANDTPAKAPEANADELKALNEALAKQGESLVQADEKIEALEAENATLREINAGLGKTVEELNAALADKDSEIAQSASVSTVKVGKDLYQLPVKKCIYMKNGKRIEITKEVLEANPELAKELVEKNNGVLIKKGGK